MQTNVFNTKDNMISKTGDSRFLCRSGLKGWAEFPLGCMGERQRCLHNLKMAKCLRKDKLLNEKQHGFCKELHPTDLLDYLAGVNQDVN